jgi:soluble lytic murein transglycosylase
MKLAMIKTVFLLGLSCLCVGLAQAQDSAAQRLLFQQAYAALQAGDVAAFNALPEDMRQYSLYPWLEYTFLNKNFDSLGDAPLVSFAKRYPNTIMADELYAKLSKRFVDKAQWADLLAFIPNNADDTALQCQRSQALLTTNNPSAALALGKSLWANADKALPVSCKAILTLMHNQKLISLEDDWLHIRAAIQAGQVNTVNMLASFLPANDQAWVQTWLDVRANPATVIPSLGGQADSDILREILVSGLVRLADKQYKSSDALWQQTKTKFKFTPAQIAEVESAIGVQLAIRREAEAITRLSVLEPRLRSDEANQWLVRMAASTNNWAVIAPAVEQIEVQHPHEQTMWEYWKARALEQLGKVNDAKALYTKLADEPSFHGFLAADRVNLPYKSLDTQPKPNNKQRIQGLQQIAALQRVREWYALGNGTQARKEWVRTLKMMDKDGLLAASELALAWNMPHLSILTAAKAKEWDNVNLRFPLLNVEQANMQARNQGIQAAWVLGVMRRESAFDASAASNADAYGLMQLILPTAKIMGRKQGLSINSKEDVLQPDTNIQLGSAYLSQLLKRFNGNYVQATAAYNAGPGRPPQWAPNIPLNADQWIETIPFTETREYVQAVLAYTTIYDHKLNAEKALRLSDRLQPIMPNAKASSSPTP